MATLNDMIARIANELDRSDLSTTEIPQAIGTAVQFYQRKHFYFTEDSFTFNTVVGQELYGVADSAYIPISPRIQWLRLQYGGGVRWDLTRQTAEYIDQESASSDWRGVPEDWCYRQQQIRLYPIPSQVWPITAFNIVPDDFATTDTTYDGPWVNAAEYLIRTRAKIELLVNVIHMPEFDPELQGLYKQEQRAWGNLSGENASREALGYAVPTNF